MINLVLSSKCSEAETSLTAALVHIYIDEDHVLLFLSVVFFHSLCFNLEFLCDPIGVVVIAIMLMQPNKR